MLVVYCSLPLRDRGWSSTTGPDVIPWIRSNNLLACVGSMQASALQHAPYYDSHSGVRPVLKGILLEHRYLEGYLEDWGWTISIADDLAITTCSVEPSLELGETRKGRVRQSLNSSSRSIIQLTNDCAASASTYIRLP